MKKRKFKKKPLIIIGIVIAVIALILFGINRYNLYVYHNSTEYKLLELGYSKEEIDLFKSKLSDDYYDNLVNQDKNNDLSKFLNEKYFIEKNIDRYLEFLTKNKTLSYNDIIAKINVNADYNWYENNIDTNMDDGYALLVNKFYHLNSDYIPEDIVPVKNWYCYGEQEIREEVYNAFISMFDAAKENDIVLYIQSSYRNYENQKETYEYYENAKGKTYADSIAARPNYSEHQTGLALDIYSPGSTQATFKDSDAYAWLLENAHEYGFILRYPEGKEDITGYNFESWHYRYLGVDLATKVKEEGITYDEYYAYYLAK